MSGNSTASFGGVQLPDFAGWQFGNGPSLQAPTALSSTPTQAQTNTTALQGQLASESAARTYGTTLTTSSGLLDQPTTTSSILLGN